MILRYLMRNKSNIMYVFIMSLLMSIGLFMISIYSSLEKEFNDEYNKNNNLIVSCYDKKILEYEDYFSDIGEESYQEDINYYTYDVVVNDRYSVRDVVDILKDEGFVISYDNLVLENLDNLGSKLLKVVLFFIILVIVMVIILISIMLEKLIGLESKFIGVLKSEGYRDGKIFRIFICFTMLLIILAMVVAFVFNGIWLLLTERVIYKLLGVNLVFVFNYLIILYLLVLLLVGLFVNIFMNRKIKRVEIITLFH